MIETYYRNDTTSGNIGIPSPGEGSKTNRGQSTQTVELV